MSPKKSEKNKKDGKESKEGEEVNLFETKQYKVYLTIRKRRKIAEYMKQKGKTNFSGFVREAINFYMYHINPVESSASIDHQLQDLEVKIEEINERLEIDESYREEQEQIKQENIILQSQQETLQEKISQLDPEMIPQYYPLKIKILEMLNDIEDHSLKEFVLMNVLRDQGYEENQIWLTLTKLQYEKIITFNKTKGEITLIKKKTKGKKKKKKKKNKKIDNKK
jgi:DNA-binding transcriptional MerR regulator